MSPLLSKSLKRMIFLKSVFIVELFLNMPECWLLFFGPFHDVVSLKLLIMLLSGFAITLTNCDEMNFRITPQCLMQ